MGKKLLLGMVVIVSGVVAVVHYQQVSEKQRMHLGVERDIERLRAKKAAVTNNMSSRRKSKQSKGHSKVRPDKSARDKQATERTLKRASELFLQPEEEDLLIQILAKLDNVTLSTEKKSGNRVFDPDAEADNEECDALPSDQSISKDKYIRKLLRDDRRARKDVSEGLTISAEKVAARVRRTIVTAHREQQQTAAANASRTSSDIVLSLAMVPELPSAGKAKKDIMEMPPTVRVIFELDKTGSIAQQLFAVPTADTNKNKSGSSSGRDRKLIVLQRTHLTVSDLLKQMRSKFNVGSKYNIIINKVRQELLSEEMDLFKLIDDDVLQLSIMPKGSIQGKNSDKDGKKKATKLLTDEILLNLENPENNDKIDEVQYSINNLSIEIESTPVVDSEEPNDNEQIGDKDGEDEDDEENPEEEKWDAAKFAQMYRDRFMHPLSQSASIVPDANLNRELKETFQKIQASANYLRTGVAGQRASLPIAALRNTILSAIMETNGGVDNLSVTSPHPQVLLVCGETGSGKTTQVPQFILEDAILRGEGSSVNIVVTQPRRIAAISVAERVAYEMTGQDNILDRYSGEDKKKRRSMPGNDNESENIKDDDLTLSESLVGYQVRLEARVHAKTRLLFCTTGLLLRRIQHPEFWMSVSHIVVDEIHERNVETDFLLTILKQELPRYPHIRLILMSATMQEHTFQEYFQQCPIVYVPGRTFPVTPHYPQEIENLLKQAYGVKNIAKYQHKLLPPILHPGISGKQASKPSGNNSKGNNNQDMTVVKPFYDAELLADLICAIMRHYRQNPGETTSNRGEAILCFLSGIQSIEKLQKILKYRFSSSSTNAPILCVLHGSMAPEQQRQAFRRTAPGQWKIVIATNIAETSITVDDVTHVIDTGLVKEHRYHAVSGLSILEEVYIARCNATQRAGRAGRVRAGHVWRLYSEDFLQNTNHLGMQEFPLPEMQRIALEDVILQVLLLQLGRPDDFLSRCLQPPSLAQLRAAIATLIEVKAVLPEPSLPLTALGYHLAHLPVDVRLGKMLVYASFLQVTEPALTIAAYLSCKSSPFVSPPAQRDIARRIHNEMFLGKFKSPAMILGNISSVSANGSNKNSGGMSRHKDIASEFGVGAGKSDSTVGDSDHLAVVRAYNLWRHVCLTGGDSAAYAFCRNNFLSMQKMQEIHQLRGLYKRHLLRAGLLTTEDKRSVNTLSRDQKNPANEDEELLFAEEDGEETLVADEGQIDSTIAALLEDKNREMDAEEEEMLVRCALCAGFAPNIVRAVDVIVSATRKDGKFGPLVLNKRLKMVQSDQKEVRLHPSSLLCGKYATVVPETARDSFLMYYLKTAVGVGVNNNDSSHNTSNNNNQRPPIASQQQLATPTITTINVFDATVIPHPAVLLFVSNEVDLKKVPSASIVKKDKNRSRDQQYRRCVRVQIAGWIEMELSELHVSFYRRVQREIENVFREQVEKSLSPADVVKKGSKGKDRLKLLRDAIGLLIRSFLPENEDMEEDLIEEEDEDFEEDVEEQGEEIDG